MEDIGDALDDVASSLNKIRKEYVKRCEREEKREQAASPDRIIDMLVDLDARKLPSCRLPRDLMDLVRAYKRIP